MKALVLASNSPRRRELLTLTGLPYDTLAVEVEEIPLPGESPEACSARLSELKSSAASVQVTSQDPDSRALIITSDTVVALNGRILGKPADPVQARQMLQDLRRQTHTVVTAITLKDLADGRSRTALCCSGVRMRAYRASEIEQYVESGDPLDKAGAYAIQHNGFHPVESLNGCFANVMGLPLCHLAVELGHFGLRVSADLAADCQRKLDYHCPVHAGILAGMKGS